MAAETFEVQLVSPEQILFEGEAEMVVAPMDWRMLAERGSAWMSYWDRHVRGGDRMASR